MQTNANSMWGVRVATFALAALAAVSATYWGLKGFGSTSLARAPVLSTAPPPANPQAVARALGGGVVAARVDSGAVAPSASSRFALVGVVANTSSGGAALIAVDGKPAKPFRVGTIVDGRLLLQSVNGRRAVLAAGMNAPAEVALELPVLGK
jgi:general secretion pathway protein C